MLGRPPALRTQDSGLVFHLPFSPLPPIIAAVTEFSNPPMWFTLFTIVAMMMQHPARSNHANPYPRLPAAARRERVLIVAPHVDDESIGAGGYAIDALANGAEVFVVFLTAGDCNRFAARLLHKTLEPTASNYLSVGRTRINEAHLAMRLLGIPPDHFFVLGYPDRGLQAMLDNPGGVVRSRGTRAMFVPYEDAFSPGSRYNIDSVLADIKEIIELVDPTTIIAPVPFDMHPDHAATAEIVDRALEEVSCKPERLGYLVHTQRVAIPTTFLTRPTGAMLPPSRLRSYSWATYPLSHHVQQLKTDLLMTYKSQRPYVYLFRNVFVRQNELFFVYPPAADEAASPARVLLAR